MDILGGKRSKRSKGSKGSKRAKRISRRKMGRPTIYLPKPDPNISLGKYGYSIKRSQKERRASLKRASKALGELPVLRRTTLISTLSKSVPDNYKKYRDDVEYLKREYKKSSKKSSRKSSKKSSKKKYNKRR